MKKIIRKDKNKYKLFYLLLGSALFIVVFLYLITLKSPNQLAQNKLSNCTTPAEVHKIFNQYKNQLTNSKDFETAGTVAPSSRVPACWA